MGRLQDTFSQVMERTSIEITGGTTEWTSRPLLSFRCVCARANTISSMSLYIHTHMLLVEGFHQENDSVLMRFVYPL